MGRRVGEPVVLVHGSIIADAFAPLLVEPALTGSYRLVSYHRRGFAGSTHPDRPLSIAEQAAHCRALLAALGIDRAHVVGHSYGGVIALQLAMDAPELVRSLALLEPALLAVPSGPLLMEAMGPWPVPGRQQSWSRGRVSAVRNGAGLPGHPG